MLLRELFNPLFEASYDGMVNNLRTKFPDQVDFINQQLKWAKDILKKDERVVWWLRLITDYLNNDGTVDIGDGTRNPLNLEEFGNGIAHFFGYESPQVHNYQFGKKTPLQVHADLTNLLQQWEKEQETNPERPLTPQEGDHEIIKFNDGTAWWFVDRAYCPEEGRSGKHCGNVVGQSKTDQRILSFRANNKALMTFILEPDGYLGEMKARGNQKPAERYHSHIVSLLLSPMIKGVRGAGYLPEMNFSVLDLDSKNLKTIYEQKPNLIADQIKAEPVEFLKADGFIRSNPEFQNIAKQNLKGLGLLIDENGNFTDTEKAWRNAIYQNPMLALYATHHGFMGSAIDLAAREPNMLFKAPRALLRDYDFLSEVIDYSEEEEEERDAYGEPIKIRDEDEYPPIAYIVPSTPRYEDLAARSVKHNPEHITYVDPESITDKVVSVIDKSFNDIKYKIKELPFRDDIKRMAPIVEKCPYAINGCGESILTSKLMRSAIRKQPKVMINFAYTEYENKNYPGMEEDFLYALLLDKSHFENVATWDLSKLTNHAVNDTIHRFRNNPKVLTAIAAISTTRFSRYIRALEQPLNLQNDITLAKWVIFVTALFRGMYKGTKEDETSKIKQELEYVYQQFPNEADTFDALIDGLRSDDHYNHPEFKAMKKLKQSIIDDVKKNYPDVE